MYGHVHQVFAGMRPGRLVDARKPQRCGRTPPSVGAPVLAVLSLRGFDGVDNTAAKFLLQQTLEMKKEEEEERRKREKEEKARKKEAQEKADLELAKRDPWWAQHLADMKAMEERRYKASSSSKRKRKKRRKRRTPRTSSLPGRARRRQRQWSACYAGFTGYGTPRVMFPSGVVRPKMLRIMAGLVQKDSCSGMARLVLLVILHLALFLLFVRPMMLGIMAGMLWKDSCLRRSGVHVASFLGDDFRNGFWKNFTRRSSSWLSPYSAQCLVRHWIHAVWFVAPCLEREVLRGVRVHSSSCGAHRDVVHSPFGWLYHRCHYNCRGLVLFVGRLPWLCGPFLLRECLRRDVVWWCIFHSWWCLRFCLGQCEADGWKIPHQLFPVPRGRWVCMHAELLVQQQ